MPAEARLLAGKGHVRLIILFFDFGLGKGMSGGWLGGGGGWEEAGGGAGGRRWSRRPAVEQAAGGWGRGRGGGLMWGRMGRWWPAAWSPRMPPVLDKEEELGLTLIPLQTSQRILG
ncbi:hypothetical protein IEQ34_010798 [Dendrobium chrysotoxum]|uniref:Uncharacterized protein n=1 Tax=Dendrobium chrysotoxum TaxID=161865 RepID=A0AAV7GVN5_DENCH|nr:hypothetical protein IEQ34_010798 [Dendrobium chrysotoxum]